MERFNNLNLVFPSKKVIAIVELVDCLELDDELNEKIINENNIAYGSKKRSGYAWKLNNVQKISVEKEIKGQLGLWNLDIDNIDKLS